jgi:hypothetical protein
MALLRRHAAGIGGLACALLAGCAVGPDFEKPAPPSATAYTKDKLPEATAVAAVGGGASSRAWIFPANGGRCSIRRP